MSNKKNPTSTTSVKNGNKVQHFPELVSEYADGLRKEGYGTSVLPPKQGQAGNTGSVVVQPWVVCYAANKKNLRVAEVASQRLLLKNMGHVEVLVRIIKALRESDAPTVENRNAESLLAGTAIIATIDEIKDPTDEELAEYVEWYGQATRAAIRDGMPFADCFIGTTGVLQVPGDPDQLWGQTGVINRR